MSGHLGFSPAPSSPVPSKRGHWLSPVASLFRPAAKFMPFFNIANFVHYITTYISSSESSFPTLGSTIFSVVLSGDVSLSLKSIAVNIKFIA